jgi:hypothetical protein
VSRRQNLACYMIAAERTRTSMPFGIRTSSVRVYQFHHRGTGCILYILCKAVKLLLKEKIMAEQEGRAGRQMKVAQ